MCIAAPTAAATVILVNEGANALRETKQGTYQIIYVVFMAFSVFWSILLRITLFSPEVTLGLILQCFL
jgi:hypothetical protein